MTNEANGEVVAIERAFELFDTLVEKRLAGVPIDVQIQWVEVPLGKWEKPEDGPNHEPYVRVNGKTAERYFLDEVEGEDMQINREEKAYGALSFGDILATSWEDTIHNWTVVLPELDQDLDELARNVYREKVLVNLDIEGLLDVKEVDENTVLGIARQYAERDLNEWMLAVDAEEDMNDLKKELYGQLADGLRALRDSRK